MDLKTNYTQIPICFMSEVGFTYEMSLDFKMAVGSSTVSLTDVITQLTSIFDVPFMGYRLSEVTINDFVITIMLHDTDVIKMRKYVLDSIINQ